MADTWIVKGGRAMGSLETRKDRSTCYAINKIIGLLSKASVDRFIDLTYWGEKITVDPEVKAAINHIRGFLTDKNHPARDLFQRVFTTLSEYKRRRIFQTLFLNAWFLGGRKRDYWEERHPDIFFQLYTNGTLMTQQTAPQPKSPEALYDHRQPARDEGGDREEPPLLHPSRCRGDLHISLKIYGPLCREIWRVGRLCVERGISEH